MCATQFIVGGQKCHLLQVFDLVHLEAKVYSSQWEHDSDDLASCVLSHCLCIMYVVIMIFCLRGVLMIYIKSIILYLPLVLSSYTIICLNAFGKTLRRALYHHTIHQTRNEFLGMYIVMRFSLEVQRIGKLTT